MQCSFPVSLGRFKGGAFPAVYQKRGPHFVPGIPRSTPASGLPDLDDDDPEGRDSKACQNAYGFLSFAVHYVRPRPARPRSTITVADGLRLGLPPGTHVAYGQQHLRRHVSWVRLFVTRPYQLTSIEPDALVVISLRGVTDPAQLQRLPRLVEALVAAQVSAIVLTDDSQEICEAAARLDSIAVLVLPKDASLPDIERDIIALILDRSTQVERRIGEVYQNLIHLALQDAPLQSLADTLAAASDRVIYLEDEYGSLQALAVPPDAAAQGLPLADEAVHLYSAPSILGISPTTPAGPGRSGPMVRRLLPDGRHAVCTAPILLGSAVAGFLTILANAEEVQDLDEGLVVRAASAFAIPIAKQRAIVETQTRLQGSFLEGLFSGMLHNADDIIDRARYLGHDLREPYQTICFALDGDGASRSPALWASFQDIARRELSTQWPRALPKDRGDMLAVLVPSNDMLVSGDVRVSLERMRVRLGQFLGDCTATCGMGPAAVGPADIVKSYRQAERAAHIGRQFLGGNQTITFEELGAYRLLASIEDRDALESFQEEYLGTIEAYDARYNGELLNTLEGFFAANGNHARAAEALHLHRNTLLYRLSRIETLTGRNLADAETRLCWQLALKIRHLGGNLAGQMAQPAHPLMERKSS